jgi:hypothetical protein
VLLVPGRLATIGLAVARLAWSPDGGAIAYSVIGRYCYTERLREQPTLIPKPVLGCYGLTWIHQDSSSFGASAARGIDPYGTSAQMMRPTNAE